MLWVGNGAGEKAKAEATAASWEHPRKKKQEAVTAVNGEDNNDEEDAPAKEEKAPAEENGKEGNNGEEGGGDGEEYTDISAYSPIKRGTPAIPETIPE